MDERLPWMSQWGLLCIEMHFEQKSAFFSGQKSGSNVMIWGCFSLFSGGHLVVKKGYQDSQKRINLLLNHLFDLN